MMKINSQGGFSLIEVVVALGLLAAVLISVSGLFVLAHRQVDGGRKHSVALSVARDIMEEMDGWGFRQLYLEYGFDGSASSYMADSRTNDVAAGWQDALDAELHSSYAEILVESLDEGAGPPALTAARCIRIQITVHWMEGLRPRSVRLASVRV
jgi:prepilin-type N-terminal cleavage/methylation domain-containing protein